MADTITEPTPTPTPPPTPGDAPSGPPSPAPGPVTFTQDQVNRMMAERIARDRATRGNERPAAQPAPASTQPQRTVDPSDALAIIELRDAFDDAVGDLSLKAKQRALLRTSVMRDRPQDVGAYVARFVEDAGWSSTAALAAPAGSAPPPAPANQPTPAAAPNATPVTDRSPPPAPRVVTDDTPLLSMQPHDREAVLRKLIAQHGAQKGNDLYVDRYMAELNRDRVRVRAR